MKYLSILFSLIIFAISVFCALCDNDGLHQILAMIVAVLSLAVCVLGLSANKRRDKRIKSLETTNDELNMQIENLRASNNERDVRIGELEDNMVFMDYDDDEEAMYIGPKKYLDQK